MSPACAAACTDKTMHSKLGDKCDHASSNPPNDALACPPALTIRSAAMTSPPAEARARPQWHEQLQMTSERALSEARRAIIALAADELVPIETHLEQTAESISGTGVHVRVAVDDGAGSRATDPLPGESIVRIVREAVTNAARHGAASHIDILFETNGSPRCGCSTTASDSSPPKRPDRPIRPRQHA